MHGGGLRACNRTFRDEILIHRREGRAQRLDVERALSVVHQSQQPALYVSYERKRTSKEPDTPYAVSLRSFGGVKVARDLVRGESKEVLGGEECDGRLGTQVYDASGERAEGTSMTYDAHVVSRDALNHDRN